jgi:hypothetical protein
MVIHNLKFRIQNYLACPFVGGTAVYKARSIYSRYAPAAIFNNLKMCNEVGIYKTNNINNNNNSNFTKEIEYLKTLKVKTAVVNNNGTVVKVYRNPATDLLTVEYYLPNNISATFTLLDINGREILSKNLNATLNTSTINISQYARGIYMYKIKDSIGLVTIGKIILE